MLFTGGIQCLCLRLRVHLDTTVSDLQRWRGLWSHGDTESRSRSGAALLSPVGTLGALLSTSGWTLPDSHQETPM